MFFVFQLIMIIVMFNVLIAIVSDVYNDVKETAEVEVRKLRAKMIIETQSVMSSSEKNDESEFPPYLEVLQAESSGFETAAPSELSEFRAEMNSEVVEIRNQMDAMASEMREIKTMMRQLVPRANARSPSPSPVKP